VLKKVLPLSPPAFAIPELVLSGFLPTSFVPVSFFLGDLVFSIAVCNKIGQISSSLASFYSFLLVTFLFWTMGHGRLFYRAEGVYVFLAWLAIFYRLSRSGLGGDTSPALVVKAGIHLGNALTLVKLYSRDEPHGFPARLPLIPLLNVVPLGTFYFFSFWVFVTESSPQDARPTPRFAFPAF